MNVMADFVMIQIALDCMFSCEEITLCGFGRYCFTANDVHLHFGVTVHTSTEAGVPPQGKLPSLEPSSRLEEGQSVSIAYSMDWILDSTYPSASHLLLQKRHSAAVLVRHLCPQWQQVCLPLTRMRFRRQK